MHSLRIIDFKGKCKKACTGHTGLGHANILAHAKIIVHIAALCRGVIGLSSRGL